jgi:hypothetical protein
LVVSRDHDVVEVEVDRHAGRTGFGHSACVAWTMRSADPLTWC